MSKSIVKNAGMNILHRFLSVVFPLISSMYVSRTLGVSGVGEVASAQNLVTYFTFVSALGIPTYGVREIAKTKTNHQECNKVFSELFCINFISTTLSLIAYYITIFLVNRGGQVSVIHYTFSALIALNYFNIEWMYQGFEDYKYITIRSVAIKITALLLMLLFVRGEEDVLPYTLCICFGTAGNNILNMVKMNRYVYFSFSGLHLKKHMNAILTLFASTIAIELYSLLDTTMLTVMSNTKTVGYYTNAVKIVKIAASMITALGGVLLPRLSLYFQQEDRDAIRSTMQQFFDLIKLLFIPSCVGLCLVANALTVTLFGENFLPSAMTIRILAPLVIFMPMSAFFSQIVLTVGREKDYFFSVAAGTVINAILNAILIPIFFQNGAAIASVATEFIILVAMCFAAQRVQHISYLSGQTIGMIVSALTMAVVIIMTNQIICAMPWPLVLVIQIVVGGITYALMLIILKNKQIYDLIERQKKAANKNPH